MSAPPEKSRIRRITVALRGDAAEARLMSSAALLARDAAAELTGVFLEDIDLLRLDELPLAIEICRSTSARRRINAGEFARQLAAQAAAAERALARVAEDAGVAWSFRVARGAVTAMLMAASAEADVTLVAATRRAFWVHGQAAGVGEDLRAEAGSPIAVVFDTSAAAMHALDVGLRLAEAEGRPLLVILIASTQDSGERLREQAERALGGQAARFRMLIQPPAARLLDAVRAQRSSMLVLPALQSALLTDTVHALEERLDCPVLLVR